MWQQGVPRLGRPPPTNKGRHAVSAATNPATGRRAAHSAAPQREDDRPAVTGLGGVVSPPPPPQKPAADGGMVVARRVGAASIPASANAGGLEATGAFVLALAGAEEAAAACFASANRRGYTPSPSAAVAAVRSTGTVATATAPTAATNHGLNMPAAPATRHSAPLRRRRWPRRSERSRVRLPPLLLAQRHRWGRVREQWYGTLLSLSLAHRP